MVTFCCSMTNLFSTEMSIFCQCSFCDHHTSYFRAIWQIILMFQKLWPKQEIFIHIIIFLVYHFILSQRVRKTKQSNNNFFCDKTNFCCRNNILVCTFQCWPWFKLLLNHQNDFSLERKALFCQNLLAQTLDLCQTVSLTCTFLLD